MAEKIMFFFTLILRLVWVLTVGIFIMFPLGTLAFIVIDLFFPKSNKSYGALVTAFKGIHFSMQTDDYDVDVIIREEARQGEKLQEEKL